jgi:TolB-like protein
VRADADQGADLTTIAILDFDSQNISEQDACLITDSLSMYLRQVPDLRVLERAEIRDAVEAVMGAPPAVCDETACAVEIGSRLGIGAVVIGSVSKLGNLISVSARVVNVDSRKVVEIVAADTFRGEEGIPETLRQVAGQLAAIKAKLPRGGIKPIPGRPGAPQPPAPGGLETSVSMEIGLGLRGFDSSRHTCEVSDTVTACSERTAKLNWQLGFTLFARQPGSRFCFGAGMAFASVKTTWWASYESQWQEDYADGSDSGFNFHVFPQVGLVLAESNTYRVMASGGVGYRAFSEESKVGRTFAIAGCSARILRLHASLSYWRAFDSESLLQDLITVSAGAGTGF